MTYFTQGVVDYNQMLRIQNQLELFIMTIRISQINNKVYITQLRLNNYEKGGKTGPIP